MNIIFNKVKKMKKINIFFLITIGFIIGFSVSLFISKYSYKGYAKVIRSNLISDQNKLCYSYREEDYLNNLLCRYNLLNIITYNGYDVFKEDFLEEENLLIPIKLNILNIINLKESTVSRNSIEGIERGKISYFYEKLGMYENAKKERNNAMKLLCYKEAEADFNKYISYLIEEERKIYRNYK